VAVLPGLSSGFFNDSRPQILSTGSDPRQVLAGNFDGHSDHELITVNAGSNDLSFFPVFGTGVSIPTGGEQPVSAVVGRLNGDGFDDVIVANNGDGRITMLLGGTAGFSALVILPHVALSHPTGLVLSSDAAVLYISQEGQEVVTVIPLTFMVNIIGGTTSDLLVGSEGHEVAQGSLLAVLFITHIVESELPLPLIGVAEPRVIGLIALRASSLDIVALVVVLPQDDRSPTEDDQERAGMLPDLAELG
jgi:hypothetical protein